MRIAFICQFFPPELGAPSARVSELARAWAGTGHDVTVVTGMPNHPTGLLPAEYQGVRFVEEDFHGVRVLRNWVYATPNEGFIKRTMNHLSFMCSSLWYSTTKLRGSDVIVVSSPTFFVVISAWLMSRVLRVPYVFEVRDLWPGIFVELGILKNPLIIGALEWLEMFLYRRAARVVVVTDSFKEILVRRGLPAGHVVVITNGVDPDYYRPLPDNTEQRTAHGLDGKCVVLYIGAHGISHALQAILESAALLRDRDDIRFVFVGEGAEKKALLERTAALRLTNVLFLPGQPKDTMPAWYASCDIALVPLRDIALFETFIPSKMFEILACERPVIGSVRGEPRRILEASGGAIVVDPEDASAIAGAVRALADDPTRRLALGSAGRAFVKAHYDRRVLAERYIEVLAAMTGKMNA
jgi:glycosyltransferase involved in cell wall biosynthesis